MAKPPADAEPEQFIIGHGSYTNFLTACAYNDEQVFRIDPAPLPVVGLIVTNSIFVAFFYGFHWVIKNLGNAEEAANVWGVYVAPIGIGLLTCIAFTYSLIHDYARARRLGPSLVYDKATGLVELPREHVSFERSQIVHLQYISTKRLDRGGWSGRGGVANNPQLSELNLITLCDGVRKRWPLLRSTVDEQAFDPVLRPLLRGTDLPVVRVKDELWGWKTTEMPYAVQ